MKMRFVFALLACVTGISSAEWTQLGVTSRAGTSYFLDSASIHETGGKITVSYLVDKRTPEKIGAKSAFSIKGENEFDCKAKRYRNLSVTSVSDHMGHGEVISSTQGTGEWSKIPPRSRVGSTFRAVCHSPYRPVELAIPSYYGGLRTFAR